MRTAAEVNEMGPQRVFRKNGVGLFGDQLALHGLIFVQLQAFYFFDVMALVRQVAGLDLPHFLFDFFQIFGRKSLRALEVVIETVLDRRTNAQLGFGKQFEHRRRQQMRRRMAINFQRLWILRRQNFQRGVFVEGTIQIP